jgi:Zn-dependent M32 family carboxypeptidase
MQKFKIKSLEEVKILQDKTLNEIKRDFKAQTIITATLVILALIICFKAWDTAVKCEELKKDKQALEDVTEMQRSMISDLEANCKDLYIQVEELKYGEQR